MIFEKNVSIEGLYGLTTFKCSCTCNGGHGHSGSKATDDATYQTKTYEEGKNS